MQKSVVAVSVKAVAMAKAVIWRFINCPASTDTRVSQQGNNTKTTGNAEAHGAHTVWLAFTIHSIAGVRLSIAYF